MLECCSGEYYLNLIDLNIIYLKFNLPVSRKMSGIIQRYLRLPSIL